MASMIDLIGKTIRINKATIRIYSDPKTDRTVKGIKTFDNEDESKLREASSQMSNEVGNKWLKRLFKHNGAWFYIINEEEINNVKKRKRMFPESWQKGIDSDTLKFLEVQEQAAIDFGATIIRVQGIYDGRK